jgi:hypothetical protein
MNFLQKKLWITWSKLRFLRLPVERRVRLEVTTDWPAYHLFIGFAL